MIKSIKKIAISLSIFTIFVFMLFFMTACNSIKNPASYSIDNNGDLIAIYDDGTIENLGNFNNQIAESIISIDISNDGYYVINGLKTNISATKVYKVEFSTGFSTTVPAQNVKDGYKAIRPEITRNGYTLIGWYCNGEEWLFNSNIVKNDIMLEAKWEANEYTITFDSNGGTKISEIKVNKDGKLEEPEAPTREGYEFDGWYYDGELYDFDNPVTGDIKLEARWVELVKVTGVELNKKSMTLAPGETTTLVATVKPENAKDKSLTWESSDSDVVIVDKNGNVEALKEGTATITVTTKDGKFTAKVKITVEFAEKDIAVTGIRVSNEKVEIKVGKTAKITATVLPTNATNKDVVWKSSNTKIAKDAAVKYIKYLAQVARKTPVLVLLGGLGGGTASIIAPVILKLVQKQTLAISIFARSTIAPSSISPVFIFLKSVRLSSIGRFRYGLSTPGCVGVPFCWAICSEVCSSI